MLNVKDIVRKLFEAGFDANELRSFMQREIDDFYLRKLVFGKSVEGEWSYVADRALTDKGIEILSKAFARYADYALSIAPVFEVIPPLVDDLDTVTINYAHRGVYAFYVGLKEDVPSFFDLTYTDTNCGLWFYYGYDGEQWAVANFYKGPKSKEEISKNAPQLVLAFKRAMGMGNSPIFAHGKRGKTSSPNVGLRYKMKSKDAYGKMYSVTGQRGEFATKGDEL